MAGELPPCRAAARPLAVLLGCLTAACAPAIGAFRLSSTWWSPRPLPEYQQAGPCDRILVVL
jgi:hypothetical protein